MWDTAHKLCSKFISDFLVCAPVSQTQLFYHCCCFTCMFISEPFLSTSVHMFIKILSDFLYPSLWIRHIDFSFPLSCFCPHLHLSCFWQNCVNKLRSPLLLIQNRWTHSSSGRGGDVAERNASSRPVARSNTRHTTHCQSTWWLLETTPLPLSLVLLAAAVHHLCPAFLLLLRNFRVGCSIVGCQGCLKLLLFQWMKRDQWTNLTEVIKVHRPFILDKWKWREGQLWQPTLACSGICPLHLTHPS